MVGAARTSVQRVLKTLEAGGLLELGYRRIAVLDPGGLVGLIGDGEAAT
jgi:hypothetical protein